MQLKCAIHLDPTFKSIKFGHCIFTLGNIHPKYRLFLPAINLALIATVPVIKHHGINEILKPFLSDLDDLVTTGVTVDINGSERTFKGAYWHS